MENRNNFHYIAVLLDMLYGIEMENEDIEELGLIAWDLIGNKSTKLYCYKTCPDSENSITLPCNTISVEAVTTSFEDWNRVTNYSERGSYKSAFIENAIEAEKVYLSPYYISGKFIKYELVGNTLYFAHNYGPINILYKGIIADDDGLPELTDKEAHAIATYIAWVLKYKEGLKTNNTVMINLALNLELKWKLLCDLARIDKLSLNDMNEILDIKDSWNRHSYSYSYKPIH